MMRFTAKRRLMRGSLLILIAFELDDRVVRTSTTSKGRRPRNGRRFYLRNVAVNPGISRAMACGAAVRWLGFKIVGSLFSWFG